MASKADDLRAALVTAGRTGSIADMQRQHLLTRAGVGTGSVADLKRSLSLNLRDSHLSLPLP